MIKETMMIIIAKIKESGLKALGMAMWAALIIVAFAVRDQVTIGELLHYTPHNVAAAILVMLALFALKSLSIVFYSGVLFTVSGILFDMPLAIAVNLGGIIIMLTLPYLIGKKQGSKTLDDLQKKHPKLEAVTDVYVGNDFIFTILLRMMRIISYDICSMYLGARKLRYIPYAAGSCLAMLPNMAIYTIAGSQIDDLSMPAIFAIILLEIAATLASLIILRSRGLHDH